MNDQSPTPMGNHDAAISRREVLGWTGAAAGLMLSPAWAVAADQPIVAGVIDHHDRWTGLDGTVAWLDDAGVKAVKLDPAKPADQQGLDAIVFGSFSSESGDYKAFMKRHAGSVARFVKQGGVVLQFTQADQAEASPPFLPDGLSATRNDTDPKHVLALRQEHPLLKGLLQADVQPARLDLPAHKRTGGWEAIESFEGFAALAAGSALRQNAVVIEAAHGKGRFIITALHFDRLFAKGGELVASQAFFGQSKRFAANFRDYTAMVRAGKAPAVKADKPFELPSPIDFVQGAWTLAVLPDTQVYSERHPEHFINQTKWIVDQAEPLNIQHVLHLGDVVNRGILDPGQWDHADKALSLLHGKVPLGVVPGNHDYHDNRGGVRQTQLNKVVPPKTLAMGKTLVELYDKDKVDNQALAFEANGQKWLMLGLEFGPRHEVLDWAKRILNKYKDHHTVVFTHAYMFFDDTRYDHKTRNQSWNPSRYKLEGSFNDAEMMWQKVLKDAPNVRMVLSGHVLNDGLGYLASQATAGHSVHQILQNYQMLPQGGSGFLRLYEFQPDGKTVQAKTYSPSLDKHRTDPGNQFTFAV